MSGRAVSRKALQGLACVLAMAAGLPGCERFGNNIDASTEIAFSVQAPGRQALWAPLLADMQKQTGVRVRGAFSDYDSQVSALQNKKIAAGWFPNLTGAEALSRGRGEVFAEADGLDPYQSLIIVAADSKLTTDDLLKCDHKLSLGLGPRDAAASGQVPVFSLFLPSKVDVEACFRAVVRSHARDAVDRVISGRLSAAAIDSDTLLALRQEHPEEFAKIRVIWASNALPEDVLILRQDLDPVTKEKLRSFFLSYGRAPGAEGDRQRAILAALQIEGFVPADNTHFIPIRQMQASVDLAVAQQGGNAEEIATAKTALIRANAERRILDSKTAPQLLADPRGSQSSATSR